MPTKCRLIEVVERARRLNGHSFTAKVDKKTGKKPLPGDMFFAPWMTEDDPPVSFAPRYLRESNLRPPLVVVLPSGMWWCVDQRAFDRERGYHGEGWSVLGIPPEITCHPSINTSGYHGMLERGILSDDMGGHTR